MYFCYVFPFQLYLFNRFFILAKNNWINWHNSRLQTNQGKTENSHISVHTAERKI